MTLTFIATLDSCSVFCSLFYYYRYGINHLSKYPATQVDSAFYPPRDG